MWKKTHAELELLSDFGYVTFFEKSIKDIIVSLILSVDMLNLITSTISIKVIILHTGKLAIYFDKQCVKFFLTVTLNGLIQVN